VRLLLIFTLSASAEFAWVVPARSPTLSVTVEGKVEINRASVETIRTGSPGALVTYIGPDGHKAQVGDILLTLDTSDLQRQHQRLQQELAVLQQSLENGLAIVQREVADEARELQGLLDNFAANVAAARAAAKPDPSVIARMQREIELARQEAELQAVELQGKREMLALGELPRNEVEDAELALVAAQRRVRTAELALIEAGDGSNEVAARRAQWVVDRHRLALGLNAEGQVQDGRGVGKEMAGTKKRLAIKQDHAATAISAKETEIQAIARAAWPHLPLQTLTISGEQGLVHTLNGKAADAAAVYEAERGYGWLRTPQTAPSEQALVLRGEADWRIDLPPGSYRLAFVLGDVQEWGCMVIKSGARTLVAHNRLAAEETQTFEADVSVGQDGLELQVGLPQKAIVASAAGAVKNQNWIHLGYHVYNNPPALYLTPEVQMLIKLRVHHLQVPFFETSPFGKTRIELRSSQGEWVPGGAVAINEEPVAFFPPKATHRYRDAEERADERTAREVTVAVPAAHSQDFPYAAHVLCRASVEVSEGVVAVPAFLVHEGRDGLYVRHNGALKPVTGLRYDQHYLIRDGIAAGDRLERPTVSETAAQGNRFTGEVIPATAVPIKTPIRSWARVESLVPHGSRVSKGDLVVTLYRPAENAHHMKARAKASAGTSNFLQASEDQVIAFLKETTAHASAVEAEKLAADKVAENRRRDQAVLASAAEAKRAAESEFSLLEARVDTLAGKAGLELEHDRHRRRRDIVALQARSRELDAIATYRGLDYAKQLGDLEGWRKARRELAVREAKIALNLKTEAIMSERALTMLEDSLEDSKDADDFERLRFIHAPADGHIFYEKGYNDMARRRERIAEEFVVWQGLTLAEILDKSSMSFTLSLPEGYYQRISQGMELPIELEDLDDRILMGRVVSKGHSLYEPKKAAGSQEAITLTRVFDIGLSFAVPEDLQGRLRPGLRGSVSLR
jgi:hypothetical protein